MNFIIAEVSNSYSKVHNSIDSVVQKDRAGLVAESEDILTEN
jgi:hypothetical protein